jgi:hypothetical protein
VARSHLKWQIFTSNDIIQFILDHCSLRVLSTGRIKVDYYEGSESIKGLLTLEFRAEAHKQCWVFGAHGGGSGEKLRTLIETNLLYTELPI